MEYAAEAASLVRNRPGFAREVARQLGYLPPSKPIPVLSGLGMTRNQQALLSYIRDYVNDHDGVSPSFDEMREAMGLASKAGIHRLIVALEDRGHILRIKHRARCIVLPERLFEFLDKTARSDV